MRPSCSGLGSAAAPEKARPAFARSHTSRGSRSESGVRPAGGSGSGTSRGSDDEASSALGLVHSPRRSTSHEHDGSVSSASQMSCATSGPPCAPQLAKARVSNRVASASHSMRSSVAARFDRRCSAHSELRRTAAGRMDSRDAITAHKARHAGGREWHERPRDARARRDVP